MKLRRWLAAGAGIFSAVAVGVALESGDPAHAVGPPADGTYALNEAGASGVTWTITAVCDQPSGTRNMNDYSDPIVFAFNCALNVVSATPEQISPADKLQNFSARARYTSMLWTFKVDKANGVTCPGGGTASTSETYAFSDETMTGTHTIMHGPVCGLPSDMKKQPFSLALTGPPPSPIERYPMRCNNIAICF
ncbi:hypothetical protein [Mycobacterium sp.]|uniref:hypothetical protein n=1 Tax=Mycobacterium sp. TaxID=1785 RepID=UPI0025DC3966|nr:hypothetical protein [Mycobacterium sp.]MBW0013948.1 hypothetical protein [Mycobacterium sp.]